MNKNTTYEIKRRTSPDEKLSICLSEITKAGIEIIEANYHSSQPWAFPYSLMIGYIAESKTENFKLDEVELDEGRWFSKEELKMALSGENKNFFVPPPMAIAHHLIKAFVESK